MSDDSANKELPITSTTLLKWGGLLLAIVTSLISVVWFAASINSKTQTLDLKLATLEQRLAELDKNSVSRHDLQEKDIERLRMHAEATDRSVADLVRKLDVAVTILERIDKKVGIDRP